MRPAPREASSAGETDASLSISLDETLPLDEALDSLAVARAQHNSGRTGEEDAFGDASEARFHPSPLRVLASARAQHDSGRIHDEGDFGATSHTHASARTQPAGAHSPTGITRTELVWDQGTLSKDRFEALRASSAVKPEKSLRYEAGAAHLSTPLSGTSRASQPEQSSVDLSSITPVEMAVASPHGFSAAEPASDQFSSDTQRELRQQRSYGYTLDPEAAAQQVPTPPTPQQLAWKIIRAAAARQPQLAAAPASLNISGSTVAAAGSPGQSSPLQYQYGGVALLQGPYGRSPPDEFVSRQPGSRQ